MAEDPDDEPEEAELHQIVVETAQAGGRLDAVIAAAVALSRAQVQRLIDEGRVTVDGSAVAKATRVKEGAVIAVVVPPPEPLEVVPEPIPLVVFYEDADLIVIDKPAGMVVHPAAGHASGTLVNALLHHCKDLSGIGGVLRPGIVHRLDKDTSGVMVAAKNDRAHVGLTRAFAEKSAGISDAIERTYLGIASPAPRDASGTLRTNYGRHPIHRKKFTSKSGESGTFAVTHWEVTQPLYESAIVRFRLQTGRTHQIRVHASDSGWPLIGDPIYGHKLRDARLAAVARDLGRQALHAATLAFAHPVSGVPLSFASPLPEDMARAVHALSL